MIKMLRKIIAIVLVSFFIMTGLAVLNQGNQNYNIGGNNINSFTSSSFSPLQFIVNKSINYTSDISSGGQTFVCFNNSLYYIYEDSIMKFSYSINKISIFLSFSISPCDLEIYNNYLIVGFGSDISGVSSTLINIYNFSNKNLYEFNLTNDYFFDQFAIYNNIMFIAGIAIDSISFYSIDLNPISITLLKTISITNVNHLLSASGYGNNIIFAINSATSTNTLAQFDYVYMNSQSIGTLLSNSNDYFNNIYDIMDFGSCGLLGSQSYYISNENTTGTTQYSYNNYATGLYFDDSNYKYLYIPIKLSNFEFTKLPVLSNNSNYQCFYNNGNLTEVFLPLGNGNNIFNSLTYIVNGNHNLYIINKNNVYVYPFYTYNLNIKSFNLNNLQIKNYFILNGIIYNDYSNTFIFSVLPIIITPLNTSSYFYNGSSITITNSDFSGSGNNLYYNLSIYYGFGNVQSTITSNSLYLIILYVVIGLGLAIFVIASVRYRI